jgi:hypothetical protein
MIEQNKHPFTLCEANFLEPRLIDFFHVNVENQSDRDHGENLMGQRFYHNGVDEVHQFQEFNQWGSVTNESHEFDQEGSGKQNIDEDREFHPETSGKQDITEKIQNQLKIRKEKGKEKVSSEEESIGLKVSQIQNPGILSKWKNWENEQSISSNKVLPENMIDHSFLASYTKNFMKKLKDELSSQSSKSGRTAKYNTARKLNPNIVLSTKDSFLVTRICSSSKLGKQHNLKSQDIFKQMEKLISWLLYINESFLINWEEGTKLYTDHSSSHCEIVDWIFNIFFNPRSNNWPLMEKIKSVMNTKEGEEFNETQLLLLEYIISDLQHEKLLDTSLNLLSHFYQECKPEIYCVVCNLNMNQGFKENLSILTYNSFESGMKIEKVVGDGRRNLIQSRELSRFKLENINPQVKENVNSLFRNNKKLKNDPAGEIIFKGLDSIFSRMKSEKWVNSMVTNGPKESEDLPISISQLEIDVTGAIVGKLSVTKIGGDKLRASLIKSELNSLMNHLKILHFHFMQSKEFSTLRSKESLSNSNLFLWLCDLLMTQEENKLSLFVYFKLSNRFHFNQKPLDCSEFSEAQIVLMDHLSNVCSHPSLIQPALYLLGYWYKHQEKNAFTEIFNDDHNYWVTVQEILSRYYLF